jgi:regulatory protein
MSALAKTVSGGMLPRMGFDRVLPRGESELLELTPEEQLQSARKKAERLIGVRDRSEAELRGRLARAGFDESVVERVVSEALSVGLVDDDRFVRLYVAGKKRSGWGCLRIERELTRYGIELACREGYPQAFFTDEDELNRARACLEKLRVRAKDQRAAQYRHLLSKGFPTRIARKALLETRPATVN